MGKIIIFIIIIIFCVAIFIYTTQPQIIEQIQAKIQAKTQEQTQDCSGNIVYGICKNIYALPIDCEGNTSGLEKGTKTISYNVIPGITCPEPTIIGCDIKCDVNCVGAWKNVGSCKINICDLTNNTVGLGKQTQEFVVSTPSKNQGKPCPGPTREVDCSSNNYIECTQCGGVNGKRVPGATCDNIKSCEDLIGIGERIDKWSATSFNVLPGCITPADIKVKCSTAGEWPNCNCKYTVQNESFCNETNTVCKGLGSECTVGHTLRESLPQPNNAPGICTDQLRNKYYNVNLDKCRCTVSRNIGNWIYTRPSCNGSTFIATSRSRPITITKTGGNKACIFPKLSNNEKILDTVENNAKGNLYVEPLTNIEVLQFAATNDLKDSTFETVEIENGISLPDNVNCKCQGKYEDWLGWTNWTDDSICPNATNYNIADSAFNITQSRSNNRTFTISNSDSLFTNYSCPEAEVARTKQIETRNYTCTRNCLGDWDGWTSCNAACPGNALTNGGISTKKSSGENATQTSTYVISKPALGTIMGIACSYNNGEIKTQTCNTGVACTINCTGGNWDNTAACAVPACSAPNIETQRTKTITLNRNWVGAVGPFNNGTPCPAPTSETCSRTCPIDCKGGNWDNTAACVAPVCSASNIETERTKSTTINRNWVNGIGPFNNGTPCPSSVSETCSRTCPIDCKGNWDNTTACVAPACNPASTETERTKSTTINRNWVNPVGPFNNGTPCPAPTSETCSRSCDIDCAGSWSGGNNLQGLGHRTYTRRANSNVGNCPANGATETVNAQNSKTGIPKNMSTENKFIHPKDGWPADGWQIVWWDGKSDENRLRWNFEVDGKIRSLHQQNNNNLYLKPNNSTIEGSDIVFSNSGSSHRWRRRDDGKIEYMGSSNYTPTGYCIHNSTNFNNYDLPRLKSCGNANNIDLV